MSKGRLLLLRSVSVAIGVLLGLCAMEMAARLLGVRPSVIDGSIYVANADPLLPYKLRPNYRGYFAGGDVTIEGTGRRRVTAREQHAPEPANVLLVSDSTTFGIGVDDAETIASRLLAHFISNRVPLGVDAIGVPGYTSWNEYAALKEYENLGRTRAVVLVYIQNDVTRDNDMMKIKDGEIAIVSNSRTHRLLRWLYLHVYISNVVADAAKRLAVYRHAALANVPDPTADRGALQYSIEAVKKIQALCAERNIDFVVALYRDVQFLTNREAEENYEQTMQQAFRAADIPFFVLKEHTDRLSWREAAVAWNDPHPSVVASDLLAQQLYRELKTRGWLVPRP